MKKFSRSVEGIVAVLLILCSPFASAVTGEAAPRLKGMVIPPTLSAEDIDVLGSWGVRNVRYLFSFYPGADKATEEEYMEWLDTSIETLDARLPDLERNGIKVILCLYSPPGGFKRYGSPSWHRIFAESWAQDAFIRAWEKIAAHYASNPNIAAYDILNEPAELKVASGLKGWSELANITAERIRELDPGVTIIIEAAYGTPGKLLKLKPLALRNIMYSFHTYSC